MRKEFHFWFFFYYVLIEKLMQGLGEEACNIPGQEAVGDGGPAGPQQGRHDVLITVTQAWLRNQSRHKCRHPVFVLKKTHDLCLFHHETSIYLHGCTLIVSSQNQTTSKFSRIMKTRLVTTTRCP